MERIVEDAGYLAHLGTPMRQRQYYIWRDRMMPRVDAIAKSFQEKGFEATVAEFSLNTRDLVLLKRLRYLRDEEIPQELHAIEREAPL